MRLNTFEEVVSFMEGFTNLERQVDHYTTRTYRLDRMRMLLDFFGHPEKSYRKLHIAGSKGKGSTASYLESALRGKGFHTGLYLSPHLTDYRERFLIDGVFADDAMLVETGNMMVERLSAFHFRDEWGEADPTTFELYTLFAFLLFQKAKVDWAVVETGLGGRLDATNTIIPEASILCPIEKEHTRILGDTIEKIAYEKSKIIKQGKPVFVGMECDEAYQVFANEAKAQCSRLYSLRDSLSLLEFHTTFQGEQVHIIWKDGTEDRLTLSMIGEVQAQNCALALLTIRTLNLFDEKSTIRSLEANHLPGRFEKVGDHPALYVDGAHTDHSLGALLRSYDSLYPIKGKRTAIYGALLDKDHEHMCRLMLTSFDHIIISQPGTYKKSDIEAIYRLMVSIDGKKDIRLVPDNAEALNEARKCAGSDGSILVCGSFYLAGAIKKAAL